MALDRGEVRIVRTCRAKPMRVIQDHDSGLAFYQRCIARFRGAAAGRLPIR